MFPPFVADLDTSSIGWGPELPPSHTAGSGQTIVRILHVLQRLPARTRLIAYAEGRLMTGSADVELPDLLAEVNARISEYAARADVGGVTWEFVCECGAVVCQDRVSLSLSAYEELRRTDAPILAEGHKLSRLQMARRRSQALIEEATALSAEAQQQLDHARRALRGS
jgi:hypothetical protein